MANVREQMVKVHSSHLISQVNPHPVFMPVH